MDWLQLFGVRVTRIDAAKLLTPLSFPGNYEVCAILGGELELDPAEAAKWSNVQRDVFVCAEEALDALGHISKLIPANLTVSALYDASNGHARRVQLGAEADFRTFVPLTLLLGKILQFSHALDIPSKLRVSNFVTFALQKALGLHPKVGNASVAMATGGGSASSSASRGIGGGGGGSGGGVHSTTLHGGPATEPGDDDALQPPFERFHELGVTPEEFEASQAPKYAEAYARMRAFVPPNITKSSLKNLLHDGVPRPLAKHVWETKILWLLCMHPQDLPKIHIADLRGKYQFHSLDIVEMRALHFWLPRWKGDSAKAEWRTNFKSRLDKLVSVEIFGDGRPAGMGTGTGTGTGEGDGRQSLEMRNACYSEAEEEGYYDPSEPLRRIYLHREKAEKKDGKEHRHSPSHHEASDGEGQGDLHYSNVAHADASLSPRDRGGGLREKRRPERHDKDGREGHRDRRSHTHSHHSKLEANLAMLDSLSSSASSSSSSSPSSMHGPAAESEYDSLAPHARRSKSKSISLPLTSADYSFSTLLQDDEVAAFAEDEGAETAANTARNATDAAASVAELPSQQAVRPGFKLTKRLSFKQKDGAPDGAVSPSTKHKMDLWSDSIDALSSSSSSPEGPQGPVVSRTHRFREPPSVRPTGPGSFEPLYSLDALGSPGASGTSSAAPGRSVSPAMSTLGSPGTLGSPSSQSSGLGYANGAGPLGLRSCHSATPATSPDADASHGDTALFALMDSESGEDEHHRHLVYQTYQTEFHDLSGSSDSAESVDFCESEGEGEGMQATPTRSAQRPVAPISQWMQSFLSPAGQPSAASTAATDSSAGSAQLASKGQGPTQTHPPRPTHAALGKAPPANLTVDHFSSGVAGLPSIPRADAAPSSRPPSSARAFAVSSAPALPSGVGSLLPPSAAVNEYSSSQKRPSWYSQSLQLAVKEEGQQPRAQDEDDDDDDDDVSEEGQESEFRDADYSSDTSTYTASETGTSDEDDEEEDSQDGSEGSEDEDEDEEEYEDDCEERSDQAYEEYLLENGSYLGLPQRGRKARRRPGSSHTGTSTASSIAEGSSSASSSSTPGRRGGDSQFTTEMFAALASVFGDSEAEAKMSIKPRGGSRSRRGSGLAAMGTSTGTGTGAGVGAALGDGHASPLVHPDGFALADGFALGGAGVGLGEIHAAMSPARQTSAAAAGGHPDCQTPLAGQNSPFWSGVWSILREPGDPTSDEARRRGLTPEELSAEKEMEDEIDLYVPVELGAEWEDCTISTEGSADGDDDESAGDDDEEEDEEEEDDDGVLTDDGSVGGAGDFAWRVSDDDEDGASRPASALGPAQAPAPASSPSPSPLAGPAAAPRSEADPDTWKAVPTPPHTLDRPSASTDSAAAAAADKIDTVDEVPAHDASEGGAGRAFSTLGWEEGDWTSAEARGPGAGHEWEEGEWSASAGGGHVSASASGSSAAGPGDGLESAGLDEGETLSDLPLEEIVMYGDVRHVRSILFPASGTPQPGVARPHMSAAQATALLQRCSDQTDELLEPLETFMLLVDDLHADVNAVNAATGAAPLHSVFSNLLLGRFLVSRGADVLLRDGNGDSPLSLCIEYEYDYLLTAFVASGGEARLIESRDEARLLQYATTLCCGGHGVKVAELCAEGHVSISPDDALELLEICRRGGFEAMREPVETFELLERLVLEG